MWTRFKTLDPWIFVLPITLMVISVVVIYALTAATSGLALAGRQAVYAGVSLVAMVGAAFVDYRSLRAWASWIYLGTMGLLALVPFIGTTQFGAKLWINLGFFQFEPGELLKLVVVIALAAFFSRAGKRLIGWPAFFASMALGLVPVLAVVLQPDLGTALVILACCIAIYFHAPLTRPQKWLVFIGLALGVLVFALSFMEVHPFNHVLKEYQKDRLASFVQPERDRTGSGYNVEQSVIAVGSGGLVGKGLGNGSQSQLNFLPVAQADFIFAVIAESWGLAGSWLILGLYAFLVWRVLQAARIAKDDFGMLICVGVAAKIIFEILVNVGMNVRMMPVTGIPLPFLSYGGTTMLTNALAFGVVQSVVMRYKRLTF